jgi:hypothetical protein
METLRPAFVWALIFAAAVLGVHAVLLALA